MGRGEEGEDMYAESNVETSITMCKTDSQWESAIWLRELKQGLGNNLERWAGGEVQEGGNMCMPMADSCWYLAENNKILYSNYPSIKNKWIKFKNFIWRK